jgi:uncharacterized protein YjiK
VTARVGKRAGTLVALLAMFAALGVAVTRTARADTPSTGVDLSQYSLVGRYALPEPTHTAAPPNSLLAQEASSVTFDWDTGTLFVVGDGGTSVVQVSKTGQLIDSMTLAPGDSPQGTTFYDTEAITYVGGGKFVLGEERYRQVNLFTYVAGAVLTRSDVETVKLGTTIGNTGIEGITYDPQTSTAGAPGFIAVKEIDPKGIFQTNIDFANGTATNGSPTTDEAANLFDPSLVPTDDFSDVFSLSNLPNLTGSDSSHLLVISQQSGKIVNVDRSGNVESSLTITDADAPLSVPDETHEGITMDRDGNIYTVNENGGGDSNHPQLWVYSPTPTATSRIAVTEVDPAGSGTAYGADWFELTNTGSTDLDLTGWKMDDSSNAFATAVPLHGLTTLPAGKSAVFLEDTGGLDDATLTANFAKAWFGSTTPPAGLLIGFYGGSGVGLSSGGDGVNIYDAAGHYRTGVSFGAAPANATFDNSARLGNVAVPAAISTPATDAVNGAFVAPDGETGSPDGLAPVTTSPPPGTTSVAITEVAPWGSGNAPYAVDWFELTNTGTSAVDLTGWKMDDNSNSFGNSVPLVGLTSLPAGKSAVFFEDTGGLDDATVEAAFAQAWFSKNALPAGFLIGHYGGSGVGLSTGGDSVNVFDAAGDRVSGISFGASPSSAPFASFDNTAGLGSTTVPLPTVSTLSAVGVSGAFLAADGAEIGSPGVGAATPPPGPSVIVSEVAPWGSGNASYAVDWFEVTNTGTSAVDLTGWQMDDNSNSVANAVALSGVSSLPAGKSAVFFEDTGGLDDATVEASFAQAWFGTSTLPTGFLIGHYGGSGVGLSTGGDAVNLFAAAGNRVTGIAFGASPSAAPFASFDNTAGLGSAAVPLPTVSTLSAVGANGAFLAADGAEIGSPDGAAAPPPPDTTPPTIVATATPVANANGWNNTNVTVSYTCTDAGSGVDTAAGSLGDDVLTASGTATGTCVDRAGNSADASYAAHIDTVKPTVTYTGNAGTYGILSTVAITCTASDALSGIATSTCTNTNRPAWSFGAGAHPLSAQATDKADNIGLGLTAFTVTVKPVDLSTLTTQFVRTSAKYQAANALTRLLVGALVSTVSNVLLDYTPSAKPIVKAQLIAAYKQAVRTLASGGWLTVDQAATLTGLAGAI